jgi:hypothetical protein
MYPATNAFWMHFEANWTKFDIADPLDVHVLLLTHDFYV